MNAVSGRFLTESQKIIGNATVELDVRRQDGITNGLPERCRRCGHVPPHAMLIDLTRRDRVAGSPSRHSVASESLPGWHAKPQQTPFWKAHLNRAILHDKSAGHRQSINVCHRRRAPGRKKERKDS
jgi:hypothetical protein